MKVQLIVAALALYSGIKFSDSRVQLANTGVVAEASCQMMSQQTETILIQEHAAPRWGLTVAQAWEEYADGNIVIVELVQDEHYILKRQGVDIEVILDFE